MDRAVISAVFTSPWLGTWGKPPDVVAWAALGAAAVLGIASVAPRPVLEFFGLGIDFENDQRRRFLSGAAFLAAFLSLGYIAFYLRGGPRIIDATSYFLEGRAIAHGKLAWSVPDPSASFRGRFLLFQEPHKLSVIFPPGYPLLLAAGFLVGAPMVIGPLIAAGLVFATYGLTRELCDPEDPRANAVAILASLFSLFSVALRYHTADTMAHGAAALGITLALLSALRGRRTFRIAYFTMSGLLLGWVMATRPISSLPISIAVFAISAIHVRSPKAFATTLIAMVPGVLFLCFAQHAQTGNWFSSSQEAYYAVSDGPPGCFRFGFGKDTGCLYEHGDFVKAHLGAGYGLVEALGTTARRLKMHALDVLNFEPLALLALWPLFRGVRSRSGLALAVVFGQMLAYLPFYFDGNYPGGGARIFADVLPIEHALAAMGVALLAPRIAFVRRSAAVLALVCLGFAVHGVFEHEALANREDGRPMYEPDVTRDGQVQKGLLFFETDHGYNLAAVPGADPDKEILAARLRGDDHDRLLLERLNHPQAHAYHVNSEGASVSVWVPGGGSSDFWRFEAEADWPPLGQTGGWAEPVWLSTTCASGQRALTLHPSGAKTATVTLDVPVPKDGRWLVTPRVVRSGGHGHGTLRLEVLGRAVAAEDDKLVWDWQDGDAVAPKVAPPPSCAELTPRETTLVASAGARWVMTTTGGDATLDRTTLRALR